jgi:hypothetical protein
MEEEEEALAVVKFSKCCVENPVMMNSVQYENHVCCDIPSSFRFC